MSISSATDHRANRPAIGIVLAAAGVTIAVAVGAVFLSLNGATRAAHTTTTHTQTTSTYVPMIHTLGAGLARIVVDPRTGQAHGTVTPSQNTTNATPTNVDVSNVGHRAGP